MRKDDIPAVPGSVGELRELAASCDEHAAQFGAAVRSLYGKLTEARIRAGRGPTGLMVTSGWRDARGFIWVPL
jgi:hypothetical protein